MAIGRIASFTAVAGAVAWAASPGPGGEKCPGHKDKSAVYGRALPCFCLYTGGCLDYKDKDVNFTKCKPYAKNMKDPYPKNKIWNECVASMCGQHTIAWGEFTSSFANIRDAAKEYDVVTIPNLWFTDILQLGEACDDHGRAMVKQMMIDGRKAYADTKADEEKYLSGDYWQCIHAQGHVSVPWLHLHTFRNSVKAEALPATMDSHLPASCIGGIDFPDIDQSAKKLYDQFKMKFTTTTEAPGKFMNETDDSSILI